VRLSGENAPFSFIGRGRKKGDLYRKNSSPGELIRGKRRDQHEDGENLDIQGREGEKRNIFVNESQISKSLALCESKCVSS